ncbi:S-layer homology domain-containing protein [Brassicibacter mesophilus]|uniref:S-layer homology domain-containing protein n=1 Tax=Brassicibacter mesophilus TaxID=745119 RepID=UPI003D228737
MRKNLNSINRQGTFALFRACPCILTAVLIISVVFSPLTVVYGETYNGAISYDGVQNYKALYNNVNFTDIKKHWAKDSIYRMSALSIIRGMGQDKFSPNNTLTREEALTLIVRLLGHESDAQLAGEQAIDKSDTAGYKILTASDYWGNGYIQTAINRNILTQEEVNYIEKLAESEKNNADLQLEKSMTSYEDNENLTAAQLRNVKNQLKQKIERNYTWKKPAKREEVAVWVSRAIGLQPINGQAQQMLYNLNDWRQIKTENLPLIEAVLQKGIMQGNDKGDFKPSSSLTRAEMAKILDNIHSELLNDQGYIINTGIVERIDSLTESKDGTTNKKKFFLVKNDDSTSTVIQVQESDSNTGDKGFIAYKNEKLTLPPDINEYDYIKYYVTPGEKVVFVEGLMNKTSTVEGFIEDIIIDNNEVKIKDYHDKLYSFKIAEGVNVSVNGEWAQLEDLLYGQEVTLKVNNGNVVDISGYIDTGEEGYIHPGERIYIGKVLYMDKTNGKVTLLDDMKQDEFVIDSFTPVMKDDTNVGINGIKEGDILRLEFDQYEGNLPIKAYIAQPDRQIANLYKGTIGQYNPNRNEIILQNVSTYNHTKWQSNTQDLKLSLGYDSNIYINGRKISKELLQSYLGREAYIATADSFGKEQALKVVFKSGYEKKYYNSIQDIAFGDKKLKVDYNEMYFDDSTIIIKDGKLIHPYNLKEDDDVFVVSHGTGNYTASLISVEGITDMGLVVYRGRIDEISQYGFELDNYDIIEGTDIDYSSRQADFNISEDTWIIDTRDGDIEEVSVEKFTNSRFLKDKDRSNYYDDYAYVIEYNDMVLAIDIIDRKTKGQVISASGIKTIDRANDFITLKEVKDWSEFRDKWNVNSAEINLDVTEALFIKNGRAVSINEISEKDSLYVIRRNDVGYIVICR